MITPFVAHIEQYDVFEDYHRKSDAADKSTAGALRNEGLSASQKNSAREIHRFIAEISRKKRTDKQLYDELKNLLTKHQQSTKAAIDAYNKTVWLPVLKKTHTQFSIILGIFITHVEQAYALFNEYALLGVPHEGTLEILCKTKAIEYLIYRAAYVAALNSGYYSYTGWIRGKTYDPDLAREKTLMVRTALQQTFENSREFTRKFCNSIIAHDDQLLEKKKLQGTLPIGYWMFTVDLPIAFKPNPQKLRQIMQYTLRRLDDPLFDTPPPAPPAPPLGKGPMRPPPSEDDDDFHDCVLPEDQGSSSTSRPVLTAAVLAQHEASQRGSPIPERRGGFSVTSSERRSQPG